MKNEEENGWLYIHDVPLKSRSAIFEFVLFITGFKRLKCVYILDMLQVLHVHLYDVIT